MTTLELLELRLSAVERSVRRCSDLEGAIAEAAVLARYLAHGPGSEKTSYLLPIVADLAHLTCRPARERIFDAALKLPQSDIREAVRAIDAFVFGGVIPEANGA